MRAFLQKASGEERDPAENSGPSSVAQHADTFSSIAAVNRWLSVQGAACNTPDFQKLRAAVSVLRKTPNPRQEEVSLLCSSWNVRQYDQTRRRPLATLITELQQAVITEGNRFRASLDGQTEVPASSAEQSVAPATSAEQPAALAEAASSVEPSATSAEQPAALAGAASSAEQLAVAGCAGKRPLDSVSAAQPGIPTKRQRDTSIVNILRGHPRDSDSSVGAAQPGPPTKQQRLTAAFAAGISSLQGDVDTNTSTAQPGAAATAATTAAAVPPPSTRAGHIQRSILQYGSSADDLAELRRAMFQTAAELRRLKRQTAADDDGSEALTKLLRQANQLQCIPATQKALQSPETRTLYNIHCGTLRLGRQPYRGQDRAYKTVTAVACRSLVSAIQTYLTTREPLNEETFPFLTTLHGATAATQHAPPRTVQELHARLNEAETLPTAPFGRHDPNEQLFNAHAWYSLTMLAALELPDVPFHVLLSTHRTATALQDVITKAARPMHRQRQSSDIPSLPSLRSAKCCSSSTTILTHST